MTARTKTRERSKERIIDGRYRLGEVKAERSSYLIYDGAQVSPERPVTIKLARARGVKHREVRAAFEREAAIRASIDHPGLSQVVELGTYGVGRPYAVSCRPPGERLADLSEAERSASAPQLIEAVQLLHQAGVSCGCIPLDAVVRTPSGRIVIDDLPEASMSPEGIVPEETTRKELSRIEEALGIVAEPTAKRRAKVRDRLSLWAELLLRWGRTPIVFPDLSMLRRARRPLIFAAAGSLGLATAGFVASRAMVEKPEPTPIATIAEPEPMDDEVQEPQIDPEAVEALEKARRLVDAGKGRRAIRSYGRAVYRAPDLLEAEDVQTLVRFLAMPSRGTMEAEWCLVRLGSRAMPALRAIWNSNSRGDYHRRRAGEVMARLGHPVDLVPLWITSLNSERCPVRRLAVKRLQDSQDPRARRPLEALADRDGWFTSYCGAEEAERALDAVAWNAPKNKRSS